MTHETIKMRAIGFLPEILLHRSPELFVKPGLKNRFQSHQDEIADEIGLVNSFPVEFMLSKINCGLS